MPVKKKATHDDEYQSRDLPRKNASYFPLDDELTVQSIRLHATRRKVLDEYFRSRGLNLTVGIRQVLYDWMDENGIH